MKKLVRLISYAKELLLIAFFSVVALFSARFSKKYKNLWLICERGDDARDNGYWFYKYLREEHPEINSRFVISKDSPDYEKIVALGGAVQYRSFEHYLMYHSAVNLISTHVQPCAPDKIMYYHLAKKGIRPRGKQTFLQHGIIKDDMSWLHAESLYIDLFVCGGRPEYENIKSTYHHPDGVVKYLGLARFDNLIKAKNREKIILVMPTWRGADYPKGRDFLKTDYYKCFKSLLENGELISLLRQYGYELVFYPHVEMQGYVKHFCSKSELIRVADKSTHDVQRLLMDCALLVTDYSSVFFDAAFLKKPILYYQFDEDDFYRYHYKKGYFDFRRDGFGPVCTTEEELISQLKECFARGMAVTPEYEKRMDDFFALHDGENCKRTFDAICRLNG